MARFKIIHADPSSYKEQILQFWDEYLPGTPPERFEWMQSNPAGPAIWFLAFGGESNQLAGTLSIMPREMSLNGQIIKAGIMGDFMTGSQYRAFGPALDLLKTVIQKKTDLGFQFIYTTPTPESIKLAQRVGFKDIVKLYYLAKPIYVTYYLKKYMNTSVAKFVAPITEQVLKLTSKETYTLAKGHFEEVTTIDESFGVLWNKIKSDETGLIVNHSSAYLYWRYFKNPLYKFRVLTYRSDSKGEFLGYIIFSLRDKKMDIFEIITLQKDSADKLLKKIILIARREECQAIYFRLSETNLFINKLRQFGFYDTKDNGCILFFGKNNSLYDQWSFFEGDRNI